MGLSAGTRLGPYEIVAAVDRRADIWSFGCVLYEMLGGRRPVDGETVTDVLASVVKSEPDWDALPAANPPPIRELIRRCLVKDPKQRFLPLEPVKSQATSA
jgi:eukaryotic-like serine/threonine-protein kinase